MVELALGSALGVMGGIGLAAWIQAARERRRFLTLAALLQEELDALIRGPASGVSEMPGFVDPVEIRFHRALLAERGFNPVRWPILASLLVKLDAKIKSFERLSELAATSGLFELPHHKQALHLAARSRREIVELAETLHERLDALRGPLRRKRRGGKKKAAAGPARRSGRAPAGGPGA